MKFLVSVGIALAIACSSASAVVVTPNVNSFPLAGPPPVIDGVALPGEWTGAPSISMRTPTYPIDTDVYFRHDATYLYVLVDALGDLTDDSNAPSISQGDEALLVFGLPPNHRIAEIWAYGGTVYRLPATVADQSMMGMTGGHRTYEFRIPFASLGIQPGQPIAFYSPRLFKGPGFYASIPYDGATRRDNEYPAGITVQTQGQTISSVQGYAMLRTLLDLAVPALSLPLLGLLAAVIGLAGVVARRRSRPGR